MKVTPVVTRRSKSSDRSESPKQPDDNADGTEKRVEDWKEFKSGEGGGGSDDGDSAGEEDAYEVETIVTERKRKGTIEYYVKWKGYSSEENTWEPEDNLNCPEILAAYKANKATSNGDNTRKRGRPPAADDDDGVKKRQKRAGSSPRSPSPPVEDDDSDDSFTGDGRAGPKGKKGRGKKAASTTGSSPRAGRKGKGKGDDDEETDAGVLRRRARKDLSPDNKWLAGGSDDDHDDDDDVGHKEKKSDRAIEEPIGRAAGGLSPIKSPPNSKAPAATTMSPISIDSDGVSEEPQPEPRTANLNRTPPKRRPLAEKWKTGSTGYKSPVDDAVTGSGGSRSSGLSPGFRGFVEPSRDGEEQETPPSSSSSSSRRDDHGESNISFDSVGDPDQSMRVIGVRKFGDTFAVMIEKEEEDSPRRHVQDQRDRRIISAQDAAQHYPQELLEYFFEMIDEQT